MLDLVAYNGYKFVGVTVTIVAGLLDFGRTIYTLAFLYSFFATAFFLVSIRSDCIRRDLTMIHPVAVFTFLGTPGRGSYCFTRQHLTAVPPNKFSLPRRYQPDIVHGSTRPRVNEPLHVLPLAEKCSSSHSLSIYS